MSKGFAYVLLNNQYRSNDGCKKLRFNKSPTTNRTYKCATQRKHHSSAVAGYIKEKQGLQLYQLVWYAYGL
jgi:hypothetical protein